MRCALSDRVTSGGFPQSTVEEYTDNIWVVRFCADRMPIGGGRLVQGLTLLPARYAVRSRMRSSTDNRGEVLETRPVLA